MTTVNNYWEVHKSIKTTKKNIWNEENKKTSRNISTVADDVSYVFWQTEKSLK